MLGRENLDERNVERTMNESVIYEHDGKRASFDIVSKHGWDGPSYFFAWSMHKAGSTLLTKMLRQYLNRTGSPHLNLPAQVFRKGVPSNRVLAQTYDEVFSRGPRGFIGWRNAEPLKKSSFDFGQARHIVLLRDPRDRLLSWYHSIAQSHKIPSQGEMSTVMRTRRAEAGVVEDVNQWINDDCFALKWINRDVEDYQHYLPPESTRVYRYEDIIFRKRDFLADAVEFLGIPFEPEHFDRVAAENDIIPAAADPSKHIRSVKFGGYKQAFTQDTREKIDDLCRDQIRRYRFNDSGDFGESLIFAREGEETRRLFST